MADPTRETKIWQTMKSMVNSLSLGLPVAWPGDTSFTESSEEHLDVNYQLGQIQRSLISDIEQARQSVTLQVSVMMPAARQSVNDIALQRAGLIADELGPRAQPYVFRDVGLWVTVRPHIMEGFREGPHWTVPVRIRAVCEV